MTKANSPFGYMESPDVPSATDPFGIPIVQPEEGRPVTREEFDALVVRVTELEHKHKDKDKDKD